MSGLRFEGGPMKTIALFLRWWHCITRGHHAQDAWCWVTDAQLIHWYIGCDECHRAFWTRDDIWGGQ